MHDLQDRRMLSAVQRSDALHPAKEASEPLHPSVMTYSSTCPCMPECPRYLFTKAPSFVAWTVRLTPDSEPVFYC